MKLMTIVGARPQFVKASVVSRAIQNHNASGGAFIDEQIVHTGQHFDDNMSSIFFSQLGIPAPSVNLDIHGGTHGAMTGAMLIALEEQMLKSKPDKVLVYGDTNSTLAGALAAAKLHIPVAHVEAGLRSFNQAMPEELNRVMTDHISRQLFCPTQTAVGNLKNENVSGEVLFTGDVMYDAFLDAQSRRQKESERKLERYLLLTIHRQELTNNISGLAEVMNALFNVAESTKIIWPIHPRTKAILEKNNLLPNKHKITMIEPVGYFKMVELLTGCEFVVTDSGGLQKEAFFAKKRCVTLRDETEWVETVKNRSNVLVGMQRENIYTHIRKLLETDTNIGWQEPYGDGNAGTYIVNAL